MIYQDPLAYLLGLEGIALLDAWAGDHDREFVDTRLAESNSGPPRKYYRLTPTGRAAFAAQKREWRAFMDAVNELLGES